MKKLLFIPLLLLTAVLFAQNGYQVGETVENFNLKNIDEKMMGLEANEDINGYIIIFTCNHCPYSVLYEDRIIELDKKYKKIGYPVIAINPNDVKKKPADSFENMIKRAEEKGFTFPYLVDETQEVAKRFGATRTPHVFIVQKESEQFVLRYIGAIDDNAKGAAGVEEKFVEDAIAAIMNGESPEKELTKAIGCTIKWKE